MVWIIIAGIFIVAFGPLLWLRPSARERRLARLRQRAYQLGLRVELRNLPRPDVAAEERVSAGGRPRDVSAEYAAYLCPLDARLRMLPSWRLLRHGDGITALPGWAFEAGRRPDHVHLDAALAAAGEVVGELPEDVIALECQSLSLGAYWLEGRETTPEQVDDLARLLRRAAAALTALDAALKAAAEAGPAGD
ncbi:MAG: hypothetical protein RIC56_20740 [Pseudomonadales bacterium]